jgi:ribosomal 30S subunit maturation factor RimM
VYGDVRERILGRLAGQVATARRQRGDSDPETGVGDLVGFEVEALDGGGGTIDEATRVADAGMLVVDTGRSIFGKTVLLPVAVVTRVDVDEAKVFVKRTKDEIKHAPRFDYIGDPDTN